ncbi:MAG: hypothetical protein GXP01_08800 [Alphaproteobacteria bacterium]|nr:hypothetical protein [Alphaproteobacteria bacterium]
MNYILEVGAALRGCLAVLLGRRDAVEHFNLTLHGLVGSLIAIVIGNALLAVTPSPHVEGQPDIFLTPSQAVVVNFGVTAISIAVIYYYLMVVGRKSHFVPFIVVYNWGSFFNSVILIGIDLAAITTLLAPAFVAILTIYFFIRAARIVIGLPPMLVAGMIIAQLASGFVTLMIIMSFLPRVEGVVPI